MTTRILKISEVVTLSIIISWAQANRKIRWVDDDIEYAGTVRSISTGESGDVRDGHVRITMKSGLESSMPVSKMVALVEEYSMFLDRHWFD